MNNLQPGLDYLGKLHASGNVLRVLGTTPYAQFVKGEIPIWISYENDGLKRSRPTASAMRSRSSFRRKRRRPRRMDQPGREGAESQYRQAVAQLHDDRLRAGYFRAGFVRPSVPGTKLPDNVADKLPSAPQVRPLDVKAAAAKKAEVDQGWAKATGSK